MFKAIKELYLDAKNIEKKDPASRNILYIILLYPGFHVLVFYRIAHFLNTVFSYPHLSVSYISSQNLTAVV